MTFKNIFLKAKKSINYYLKSNFTTIELFSLTLILLFFLIQKWIMFLGFQTHFWDQYFFDHAINNIAQGKGWTMNHHFNYAHFFTLHFQPAYYLLVPFYLIKATPFWIFFIQSLCLILSLVPIIKYSKKIAPHINNIGTKVILFTFFIYVPFRSGNLTYLHAEVFIMPIFAWISYYILVGKIKKGLLLSLILPFFKENIIVYYFGISAFLLFRRKFKLAFGLGVFGIIITVIIVKGLMPLFGLADYYHLNRFSYLNPTSVGDVLIKMASNPDLVIQNLLSKKVTDYLLGIFGLLCFFPLFSSTTLLATGVLLQNCLSDHWSMLNFISHYSMAIIPVLIMASIHTLSKLTKNTNALKSKLIKVSKGFLLLFIILNSLFFIAFELRTLIITKPFMEMRKNLKIIPEHASVCASPRIVPHFFYRNKISEFSLCNNEDYLFLEKIDPYFPINEKTERFIANEWANGDRVKLIWKLILGERHSKRATYQKVLDEAAKNKNYQLIKEGERFLIYKRTDLSKDEW